jgi:hypothetical protein
MDEYLDEQEKIRQAEEKEKMFSATKGKAVMDGVANTFSELGKKISTKVSVSSWHPSHPIFFQPNPSQI